VLCARRPPGKVAVERLGRCGEGSPDVMNDPFTSSDVLNDPFTASLPPDHALRTAHRHRQPSEPATQT
jgi:hypothetical protein